MPLYGETWRPHPFQVGRRYRARRSFDGPFDAGGVYWLIRIDHSHYDECSVFTFVDEAGGTPVAWWWRDSEPESACTDNFEALDG
jgi:hypothetical protein